MRSLLFFSIHALLLAKCGLALGAEPLTGPADVRADRLEVEHEKRTARFQGHVRAVYGDLTITCHDMMIRYDEKGEIVSLKASGQVSVSRDDVRAHAERAELRAQQRILVLEGKPTLIKGPNRLQGSRIEIHLATQRLDVKDARGTFQLGEKEGS